MSQSVRILCVILIGIATITSAWPWKKITTTKPTTTELSQLVDTSTTLPITSTTTKQKYYLDITIPDIPKNCVSRYACKRKIKEGTGPEKICLKYCVNKIDCPNGPMRVEYSKWCVSINPDYVEEEATTPTAINTNGTVPVMQVNMIDFPCQPGFLPDRRGRCREIW